MTSLQVTTSLSKYSEIRNNVGICREREESRGFQSDSSWDSPVSTSSQTGRLQNSKSTAVGDWSTNVNGMMLNPTDRPSLATEYAYLSRYLCTRRSEFDSL